MEEGHEEGFRREGAAESSWRGQDPVGSAGTTGGGAVVTTSHQMATTTSSSSSTGIVPAASGAEMELPFLVTHYLSNYRPPAAGGSQQGGRGRGGEGAGSQQPSDHRAHDSPTAADAVHRIRRAATELASAFEALGAFGEAARPNFSSGDFSYSNTNGNMARSRSWLDGDRDRNGDRNHRSSEQQGLLRPASFADVKRKWSQCDPRQLEVLVRTAVSTGEFVESNADRAPNLVQASLEGKKLGYREASIGPASVDPEEQPRQSALSSSLVRPVLLSGSAPKQAGLLTVAQFGDWITPSLAVELQSAFQRLATQASGAARAYFCARDERFATERQLRQIHNSIQLQQRNREDLVQQRGRLGLQASPDVQLLDDVAEGEHNCSRILAQLGRDLEVRSETRVRQETEHLQAEKDRQLAFEALRQFCRSYRDPLDGRTRLEAGKPLANMVLRCLNDRERGLSLNSSRRLSLVPSAAVASTVSAQRRAILLSRMSHAATINTHASFPIYCLRFDKTGRYFITGADDFLVRVFALGGTNQLCSTRHPKSQAGTVHQPTLPYARGAILVCTLRGHAGVINDIDVSSDNSLLATASEDGDCRVWGLKDGSPVAILRGHVGGANMVSWSTLTPYRLVTTSADGYARTWDVREACLKRYAKVIGKRPEYRLQISSKTANQDHPLEPELNPPPLQSPGSQADDRVRLSNAQNEPREQSTETSVREELPLHHSVALPSLPPAPVVPLPLPPLPPAPDNAEGEILHEEGAFVANDVVDEGVQLLSRLKHSSLREDNAGSPGARSRRAPIKVICLARCPRGGHFATGSDDGVCRVWRDEDDPLVERVDSQFFPASDHRPASLSWRNGSRERKPNFRLLFATLNHTSAITDLHYSNAGDRILSASQKDGVVRILTWDCELTSCISSSSILNKVFSLRIQLINPRTFARNASATRRRTVSSSISCDVASWICDDTKIVTSQSEPLKASGTEIIPGSQFIFLWDSFNGSCLLGIDNAHEKQCPAVIAHPFDPSILCSAGADGVLKIWDCETGKVSFTFQNLIDFGPADPNAYGKPCGFLDGSFSPDGTELVVTDESGRVSIFNCSKPRGAESLHMPTWMKEQYFANDYYDLLYDSHGYCIEKGSELPPHLAPTGVRCSYGGIPHPDVVTLSFKKLAGPMPISEQQARLSRQIMRGSWKHATVLRFESLGNCLGRYDPKTTIFISELKSGLFESMDSSVTPPERSTRDPRFQSSRSPPRLSSNWRWSDYDDLITREGAIDEVDDPNDEEYEQTEGRRASVASTDDESDVEDDATEVYDDTPAPARRRSRRDEAEPVDSSDSEFDEFVSTNTTPSGPFVVDYETHFFRMSSKARLLREWLLRTESNSSLSGRKVYAPQLGDSLVYIPRAHYEVCKRYPRLPQPWQQWPSGVAWPVVRCTIRSVRYRFPYKEYFKPNQGNLRSIVALLTLEITGIPNPQESESRRFTWPTPDFVEPPDRVVFELSLFVGEDNEFLIPTGLYEQRLSRLEAYGKEGSFVDVFYREGNAGSDPLLRAYRGRIDSFEQYTSDDCPDPRIEGSGYQSITVQWTEGDGEEILSPWELDIIADAVDEVSRARLKEEEKRKILRVLSNLNEVDVRSRVFFEPVDVSKYSDYENMVEVPMDLSFVTSRIETDYYVSALSVYSDVKLVYENCMKYNGSDDELSGVARAILDRFAAEVLSSAEIHTAEEFEKHSTAHVEAWRLRPEDSTFSRPTRRPLRNQTSELENVAIPPRGTRSRPRNSAPEIAHQSTNQVVRRNNRSTSNVAQTRGLRQYNHRRAHDVDARSREPHRSQLEALNSQRSERVSSRPVRMASLQRRGGHASEREEVQARYHPASAASAIPARSSAIASREAAVPSLPSRATRQVYSARNRPSSQDLASNERGARTGRSSARGESTAPARTRSSRSTAASRSEALSVEQEEPSSSESASVEEVTNLRSRLRSSPARSPTLSLAQASGRRRTSRNTAPQDSDSPASQSDESDSPVASRRSSTHRSSKFELDDSENEDSSSGFDSAADDQRSIEEDENEEDESDSDAIPAARNRNARSKAAARGTASERRTPERKTRTKSASPESTAPETTRRSGRRTASSRQGTYTEQNESEFTDSDEDENESSPPTAASRKRKEVQGKSDRPKKKPKADLSELLIATKEWPEIDIKHITKVTREILARLRTLDESQVFSSPVVEAYPEVAESYLEAIEEPMDFRTIEEERLPSYESIRDLHGDLTLTFRNCMTFNRRGTEFWLLAQTMAESLEDVFRDACKTCRVLLPRRW